MNHADILRLLPEVFQRTAHDNSPLLAVVQIMDDLHAPAETILANLDQYFHPYRTPERFLQMLAAWVDLERLFSPSSPGQEPIGSARATLPMPPGRLRELILHAAELSQWRGTARGLQQFLEVATGLRGFVLDEAVLGEDARPRPFHLRVTAPSEAREQRGLIERIVSQEKPAYVTHEVAFQEA